ncbi:ABC transporter ATP-binding protein [Agilicoccus flavus]|uniref:ABC transporter ATP-binding protein n=1 Tax=Agilicoccus flavus TaxID=2775968 RepID=UPI001CF68D0A|nr:ATP-binding cassette domain-containing protein [Agilicoccus flavus]
MKTGMRARVQARGLGWTPLGATSPVLCGIDLEVGPGERVLLAGPSGSGKSTLLRALAGVLEGVEAGDPTGRVTRPEGERVGLLLQDPRDARVADRVGRDVAYGPENAGLPRPEIRERIAWALDAVAFPYGPERLTSALSGGEAQRLALAGVLAARPGLLLLDEPTSMLDDASARRVRDAVLAAVAGTDIALVVVEHRLAPWVGVLDRLVVLGGRGSASPGGLLADGPLEAVLAERGPELLDTGVWVPGAPPPTPIAVPARLVAPRTPPAGDVVVASGAGLVRAPRRRLLGRTRTAPVVALEGVDAVVRAGGLLAVRGPSGAGKSSLVDLLVGLDAPTSGSVGATPALAAGLRPDLARWSSRELAARVGWVPQAAEATIVGSTVRDCLLAGARALRRPEAEAGARAEGLAEILGLTHALDRNPHRLSGGETRRLAVASALVHGPGLLGLDEPTVGQDRHTWAAVAGLAGAAADAGLGVVVSTHDGDLAAHAHDVLTLREGRVA